MSQVLGIIAGVILLIAFPYYWYYMTKIQTTAQLKAKQDFIENNIKEKKHGKKKES